jgi:hypothetical protein
LEFSLDAGEELVWGLEKVGVLFSPFGGEFALEGVFEEGLAIDAELPPRPPQTLLPGVQLAEQLLDLRHNPLLLGEGWKGHFQGLESVVREVEARVVDACLELVDSLLGSRLPKEKFQKVTVDNLWVGSELIHLARDQESGARCPNQACYATAGAWPGAGDENVTRLDFEMCSRIELRGKMLVLLFEKVTVLNRARLQDTPIILGLCRKLFALRAPSLSDSLSV